MIAGDLNSCLAKKTLKLRKRLTPDDSLKRRLERNECCDLEDPKLSRHISAQKIGITKDPSKFNQMPIQVNPMPMDNRLTFGMACEAAHEQVNECKAADSTP